MVFIRRSIKISTLPRRRSRKSSVSLFRRRAVASASSMIWRARDSEARTTSVRCTMRSACVRAASMISSASRCERLRKLSFSFSKNRASRTSCGRQPMASSSRATTSSRSMRGVLESGTLGALEMRSMRSSKISSASPICTSGSSSVGRSWRSSLSVMCGLRECQRRARPARALATGAGTIAEASPP